MRDILTSDGAVVAADSYAARTGALVLREGGNAIDAAVAALLVECVVQPHNVGLGGYAGTMCIYLADTGATVAVDFDSVAPILATPDMFPLGACSDNWDMADGDNGGAPGVNEHGYLCVTAPPIVAGLALVLREFGTMSFADVAGPAQALAENGFAVYPTLEKALGHFASIAEPPCVKAFLPNGRPPKTGELLVQKDLAALIAELRRRGPEHFYASPIVRTITGQVQQYGGILEEADFRIVKPSVEEPLSVALGEFEVFTPPPPSGGLSTLQIAAVARLAELALTDLRSPRQYHILIEAAKHAWADRFAYLGDPLFIPIPIEKLLSRERAEEVLRKIETGVPAEMVPTSPGSGAHTVHLSTADAHRNFVSVTATHGSWFGSMVVVDGLGLVLGNGMSRFDPLPGRPNSVAPGKRMQHNMTPLIITRNGMPHCAIGLPGGRKMISVCGLLAHTITEFGLTPGEAIDLPRFHVEIDGKVEIDCAKKAAEIEREFGAELSVSVAKSRIAGPVAGVMLAQETNQLLAASEAGPECVAVV